MTYTPENGQINDATWRAQGVAAFGGDYLVEPVPSVAVGDSTTSIETTVSPGAAVFGSDPVAVAQQTVTHPDAPAPGGGPNGEDEARVDLVAIDSNGSAGRMVGTPAVPRDADGNAVERRFPNVVQPVPDTPTPADDVVVVAAIWIPAGTGSSAEMFADWVIPREVPGGGLFDLDLIPGRDLQYVLDQAREGETLVGDRSQVITLTQPLTLSTPNVRIRGLNVRYANGTATSTGDDMLTLAADGCVVENSMFDGNKANQTADADAIAVTASDCRVQNIDGTAVGDLLVRVAGTSSTVADSTVENIAAADCGGAVMVEGAGTARTTVRNVTSKRAEGAGAVTVRNGPNATRLRRIHGEDQPHTVRVADFGADNSDTAPIEFVTLENITANRNNVLLSSGVDTDVLHQGLVIDGADASRTQASQSPRAPIDVSGFRGVRIRVPNLRTSVTDSNVIFGANCSFVSVADSLITSDSDTDPAVAFQNTSQPSVTNCQFPGPIYGAVSVGVNDGTTRNRIKITGNITTGVPTGNGIQLRENGGTLDDVIVTENMAGPIENQASGANVIQKDNFQ